MFNNFYKRSNSSDLYHIDLNLPGMVFWQYKGFIIFKELKNYIYSFLSINGYLEIKTPLIINYGFLKQSKHLDNFDKNIFKINTNKLSTYIIKPLNCPNHILLFIKNKFSYKDLPVRYLEFGSCYRNEFSGGLYGLMRLRGFVQDDAHIFCSYNQILDESIKFQKLVLTIYKDFGFKNIYIKLSLRPLQRLGLNSLWDITEKNLRNILITSNSIWEEFSNEGAFYGPKIEYHIKDKLGKLWQCGTLQLDMILPKLLNVNYISKNNIYENVIILHRAVLGSIERFIGILLEHYDFRVPTWISPVQVIILIISYKNFNYSNNIFRFIKNKRIRVIIDITDHNISYKIYKYICKSIPYILIIGFDEIKTNTVSIRSLKKINFKRIKFLKFILILLRDLLLYI